MTSEIGGYYETCDGCDKEIIFHWKQSRLEITDKKLSRTDGDYSKGLVKIDSNDFIDFLLKSDFLQQYGYKIVKNSGNAEGSEDFNVEINGKDSSRTGGCSQNKIKREGLEFSWRLMVCIVNNQDGISRTRQNDKEYVIWTHANVIKPYIKKFLSERYPGKLVIEELNRIDLSVPEENLPIEIQATKHHHDSISFAAWEDAIRRQIDQGIVYGKCWFFFDSELLRAMRDAGTGMSINMDWFRELVKEEKLKTFTVSYNGTIEEKVYKDFDFLAEVSQTCKFAAETDDMILNTNKLKIFASVVNGYGFIQKEIDKFEDDCRKYCEVNKIGDEDKSGRVSQFLIKQTDKRARLYGGILQAVGNLPGINRLLDLCNENMDICNRKTSAVKYKQYASLLGIFDVEGSGNKFITTFVDRFIIRQYFPGYLKNKKAWDRLAGHGLNYRQFENIIKNGIGNYFWYEDTENGAAINSEKIDDKGVNVTIECRDQIITLNIKDKKGCSTKQKTIEDAWGVGD